MKNVLGSALLLAAAALGAQAQVVLDSAGGSVFATSIDGSRASVDVRTADGALARFELVGQWGSSPTIQRVSHSTAGTLVHAGAGGGAPLTTAWFRAGGPEGAQATFVRRDPRTGSSTRPTAVRTVALDPQDPAATLLDAGQLALPDGSVRAWVLIRRSSGEGLLVDYDPGAGAVRRTPLGYTPPVGTNKGNFVAGPDGRGWFVFASSEGARFMNVKMTDLMVSSYLAPVTVGTHFAGDGFDLRSIRLGIIAILIGLAPQSVPALSYQQGDELVVAAFDGTGFRTVARQPVPPGASGLMEDEDLFTFFYLLPYVEQEPIYRCARGGEPELIMSLGR